MTKLLALLLLLATYQDDQPKIDPPKLALQKSVLTSNELSIDAPKAAKPSTHVIVSLKGFNPVDGAAVHWLVTNGEKRLGSDNVLVLASTETSPLPSISLTAGVSDKPYKIIAMVFSPGKAVEVNAELFIADGAVDGYSKPIEEKTPVKGKEHQLRVMLIYDKQTMSAEVKAIIEDKEFKQYLDKYTFKDDKGRPEARIFDDDYTDAQVLVEHSQDWLDVYNLAKADRTKAGKKNNDPWLVISTGEDGESISLPLTKTKLIERLDLWRKGTPPDDATSPEDRSM